MKVFLAITLLFSVFTIEALSVCIEEPVKSDPDVLSGKFLDIKIDNRVRKIALKATDQWNSMENEKESYFKVTCIRKAQMRSLSGVRDTQYKIKLSISETQCSVANMPNWEVLTQANVDECELKRDGQTLNCEFTYYEYKFNSDFNQLTSSNCQIDATKQSSLNLDVEKEVNENTDDSAEHHSEEDSHSDEEEEN